VRKVAIAMPTAALMGVAALTAGPAITTASANDSAASLQSYKKGRPVSEKHFEQYNLKGWELQKIAQAIKWADSPKARSVRQCESGGNYKINTGNGYYGAYQFAYGTWLGSGGGRFARTADRAPKWAQDLTAWRLWKKQGWGPWGCA